MRDMAELLAKATRGPWSIFGEDIQIASGFECIRIETNGSEGRPICEVVGGPDSDYVIVDEDRANSELLALAPTLASENIRLRAALEALLPSKLCGESWNLPDTEHVAIDTTFGALKLARSALSESDVTLTEGGVA